ncbi:hypothetical protein C1645_830390 [Glomus cerebriforme]|uniref:RNase H type-1 domain-containing protein n=1 Tax=Glomus cerebriforme TaxID=658196 RepID=A0A397SI33_9GLOM|nr:hypothetical protein C1645_830390 [Glomus cerebriforme]
MFTLCKHNNISFDHHSKYTNEILGGTLHLNNIISFQHNEYIKNQLRGRSIMFLSQLVSLDHRSLLPWHTITSKTFSLIPRRAIPKWFLDLERKILVNSNDPFRVILPCFIQHLNLLSPSSSNTSNNFNAHSISFPDLYDRHKNFVSFWDTNINSFSFGRIITRDSSLQQFSIEHWIVNNISLNINAPSFIPCGGCSFNNPSTLSNYNILCANYLPSNLPIIINTKRISSCERSIDIPLYELHELVKHHFLFFNNLISYIPPSIPYIPDFSSDFISTLIDNSSIKNELFNLQRQLSSSRVLEFYTDGSLINPSSSLCSMSCGFIQTSSLAPHIQFSTKITNWPSAFRAELAAVVLAIFVSPPSSIITIFTDCASLIQHFNYLRSLSPFSYRNIFKQQSSPLFWSILFNLLSDNNISLSFQKVQAHSSDRFNNMIDALIKDQHVSTSSITFLPHNLPIHSIIPKWNNILIDTHLRKFLTQISNCKNFESFINLHRNSKYRSHISEINWDATFQYFDSDSESKLITTFISSYRKSHKIKILIEELPTIEHMKKACPILFANWFCPLLTHSSRLSLSSFTLISLNRLKKQVYIDPSLPGAIGISLSHYKKHMSRNNSSLELLKCLANHNQSPDYFLGYDHESLDTELDLLSYNDYLQQLYLHRKDLSLFYTRKKIQAKSSVDLRKFLDNILWPDSPPPSKISWNDIKSHYHSLDPTFQPFQPVIDQPKSKAKSKVVDKIPDLQSQIAAANINSLDENEFEDFFYDDFDDDNDDIDSVLNKRASTSIINISTSSPSSYNGDSISPPYVP